MSIILSIAFWLLVYGFTSIFVLIFFPLSFIFKKTSFIDYSTRLWSKVVLWLLEKILRIKHEIIGLENLENEPYIIACKHQSMWETIIFHLIFKNPSPSYIYKKELMKVPFYGWYVKRMPCIKIDRKAGATGLKDMIKQAKYYLSQKHNIVIFPQGTRTPIDSNTKDYPYQVGVAALYKACNVEVIPVALNSGKFWAKSLIIKRSGTIKIELLPAIKTGLAKKEFMEVLEEKIEAATQKLK